MHQNKLCLLQKTIQLETSSNIIEIRQKCVNFVYYGNLAITIEIELIIFSIPVFHYGKKLPDSLKKMEANGSTSNNVILDYKSVLNSLTND